MRLEQLSLHNFRNYESVSLHLDPGLNIFVGDNAQGKTNLLEAIYVLSLSKSYRAARDAELIRHGAEQGMAAAKVAKLAALDLGVVLSSTQKKRLLLNGKSTSANEFVGHLTTVLFTPDSLQLVKGSPAERRRFLDIQICQIDSVYRKTLLKYQRVVRQRNSLLKGAFEQRSLQSQLPAWDRQLVSLGTQVVLRRQEVVAALQRYSQEAHGRISRELENLQLIYQPFFVVPEEVEPETRYTSEEVEELFWRQLQRQRQEELRRGYTLLGPQRDDLIFRVNNLDLRKYGSQGQQRTAVLAYILAELQLMEVETGEYPVVLLDDVMSELDKRRRLDLLTLLNDRAQTIVTTTNLDSFTPEIVERASVFTIRQGKIL